MRCREICNLEIRQSPEGEGEGDERRAYISAVISSGKTDNHGTYMTERTLENFAQDLKSAIQFKDSHRRGQGFGVSTDGEYSDGVVTGDFKLIRGMPLTDASYPNSDVFIDAIDEGVITRVSVGFNGGKEICNICEAEWLSRSCMHWPGREYEQTDPKTGETTMVRCEVAVDDAHLVEVSAVSRGSNPDAQIVEKAERMYAAGLLPQDVQRELFDVYEMRFDGNPKSPDNARSDNVDLKDLQEQLDTVTKELDESRAEVNELKPLAECGREGRRYMTGLCREAYKVSRGKGVRDEDIERYEKRLATLNFVDLEHELTHLRELAPSKPDVKPGAQVKQPDESGNRDAPQSTTQEREIQNPTWWDE